MTLDVVGLTDWMADTNWQGPLVRLLLATLLGGLIGLEREHHGRGAGLRTQILVSLGAALAAVVSLRAIPDQSTQIDPGRMAYGIMAGVGFLGGGVIIHSGMSVRGLTTAASLWCTAAVGLACGFGIILPAAICTVIILLTLSLLGRVEKRIPIQHTRTVTVTLPIDDGEGAEAIDGVFRSCDLHASLRGSRLDYTSDTQTLRYMISIPSTLKLPAPCKLAEQIPGVRAIEIE